jgi:sugar phosphate isomerase/epimerase
VTGRAAAGLERLSLNQITVNRWSVEELAAGCARAGVTTVGLWRDKVAAAGLRAAAGCVADAGLSVSSLCRGGFFPAPTAAERAARLDDNRRALEEAATLGTGVLYLVCGGVWPGRDLDAARRMVADGVAALVPDAAAAGVRLAIEPLHPMVCADRSVIVTLAQALDLAERFPAEVVGVAVDTYNTWWDPEIHTQIARAAGRIVSVQVSDWLVPLPDPVMGRGIPGDGCIQLRRLVQAVTAAGYDGPIEVEVFNQEVWDRPPEQVVELVKQRFLSEVV